MSSDSMSLEQIWNDAAKRFASRTSRNLKLKPPKTLDDVRIEIEKQNAEIPDNLPDTKQKVKEAGMSILYCLKLLGGVAAQGASVVSSESSGCW